MEEKDKRVKSALEIAMEKAASLPGFSQEEIMEQKQQEFQPRGAAIAHRYLEGVLRQRDLPTELSRYQGQEAEIVKKALLMTLCQSVKLEGLSISLRAVDGIQALQPDRDLAEAKKEIGAASVEFRKQVGESSGRYEAVEKERLRRLGISGSAVRPNLEESGAWQEELKRIRSGYDSRISKVKEGLC